MEKIAIPENVLSCLTWHNQRLSQKLNYNLIFLWCFEKSSILQFLLNIAIIWHELFKKILIFSEGALMNEMRDFSEQPPAIILENTAVKWKRRHFFIFIAWRPWRKIRAVHLIHYTLIAFMQIYTPCVCARAKDSIMWLPIGSSCSKTVILLTSPAKIVPSMQHSVCKIQCATDIDWPLLQRDVKSNRNSLEPLTSNNGEKNW